MTKATDDIVELFRTDAHQMIARDEYGRNSRYGVTMQNLLNMNPRAVLAERLLSHFGVIAAQENGEDSTGRSKIGLMPTWGVVDRCCQMADEFWNEIERRGWVDRLPDAQEIAQRWDQARSEDSE